MQRRWEEQLAGYVGSAFRVANLGNWASQAIQLISKLATAGILYFGAKAGDRRRADGRRARRLQHAGRPRVAAGPAPGPALAGLPAGAASRSRASATSSTRRRSRRATPGRGALPAVKGAIRFDHVNFRYRLDGPEVLRGRRARHSRRPGGRHRRPLRLGQEHADQAGAAALRAGARPRAGRRHRPRAGRRRLAAPPDRRRAAGERAVQPHRAREHRARRSRHADRAGGRGGQARRRARIHPANCRKATTPWSASAAAASPAASASASPSRARWSPTRAS